MEDLGQEVVASSDDEPDDNHHEVEKLPLREELPARPARCPRGPCLKRNTSGGSDFGLLGGAEAPVPPKETLLSSSFGSTEAESAISNDDGPALSPLSPKFDSRRPSFTSAMSVRVFRGCPVAPKRQVHFDDAQPEAGVTHSKAHYDRTPIESTQGKGSSLDLSLRRCKSKSEDEGEDDAGSDSGASSVAFGDREEDALSPLALKVNHSGDYFGSTWARFKAGSIIGYDAPAAAAAAAAAAAKSGKASESKNEPKQTRTALPKHSFRCFGGLAGATILSSPPAAEDDEDGEDAAEKEVVRTPVPSSTGVQSADATPMPSPSLTKTYALQRSYFDSMEQDASPLSPTRRTPLRVDTHGTPPSDTNETPTQPKLLIPDLSVERDIIANGSVPALSVGSPASLTASALQVKQLEMHQPASHHDHSHHHHHHLSGPTSPHHDGGSDGSTATTSSIISNVGFASDTESPPHSSMDSSSSGCTSPDHALSFAPMHRASSADSAASGLPATSDDALGPILKQTGMMQITQEDLDRIPAAIRISRAPDMDAPAAVEPSTNRLADRLALADAVYSSGSNSSSPLMLTDDESIAEDSNSLRHRFDLERPRRDHSGRSVSESFLHDPRNSSHSRESSSSPARTRSPRKSSGLNMELEREGGSGSGSGSCSGSGAERTEATAGADGTKKKRKKKLCAGLRATAFRCSSFDDDEGALGGF